MVSIGPYHHNEERFHAMEEHKHYYLRDFLERNSQVNVNAYINTVQSLLDCARVYYCEHILLSDDKFVQMLLLDGCFLLELVLKLGDDNRCLCWARWDFMTILSDLLLIENQIPFVILEKLYAASKGLDVYKSPVDSDLKSLVVNNLFAKYLGDNVQTSRVQGLLDSPVHHLLHLYHDVSLPNPETRKVCCKASSHLAQKQKHHRLPLVIPSATRLLEFGFVLRKQDLINNCDVTLKHSAISIPRLIIDSTRQTLLMNLLAFEHGLEETKRRWTGMMVMMNCLVKNKSDLEILQRSGIVLNLLPSEDEMIQFFGQLSKRVASDFNDHYFWDLFEQVNLSCEAYFRQKRARLMHEYFNNRWAVISFVSSIVAIFLSTVQTLVSVYTYRRRFH